MIPNAEPHLDVSLPKIESYLRVMNWVCDGEIRKVATIWHRSDAPSAEVILPLSADVKDFALRLKDALMAIASHECRSVAEVIDDITGVSANVITVRVIGRDTAGGTIPIEDGVLLIRKAKELLYSASMSVYAKRRQFQGTPPRDAKAYMDSLLLGQTEVGSYIVNVISPLDSTSGLPADQSSETSLTEAVAHSLVGGLEALVEASEQYERSGDLTAFEHAVARGVSANMCDALIGFSGKERDRDFEISVSNPSGPMFGKNTRIFAFEASDVETLQSAASFYRNDYVLRDREIIGFIRHLHRPKGDEVGTITIEAAVGDVERNVQVQLGPDEYHQAVIAHDRKKLVQCRGHIHVRNRTVRLLEPSHFRVVDIPTLF
ncbi:MAG TPA: hypothetical protein VEY92_01040 [Pseudoxanthomonas sp.]|nr:hypothetical protein [Pseudoxanthomonas sp.]